LFVGGFSIFSIFVVKNLICLVPCPRVFCVGMFAINLARRFTAVSHNHRLAEHVPRFSIRILPLCTEYRVHVRIVGRFLLSSQSPILQCFPFACSTQHLLFVGGFSIFSIFVVKNRICLVPCPRVFCVGMFAINLARRFTAGSHNHRLAEHVPRFSSRILPLCTEYRVHVRIVGRFLLSSQSPILQCFPFACSTQPPCAFPPLSFPRSACPESACGGNGRESSTPPFWIQPRVRNVLRHRKSFYQKK
jgi:hypothetical protein